MRSARPRAPRPLGHRVTPARAPSRRDDAASRAGRRRSPNRPPSRLRGREARAAEAPAPSAPRDPPPPPRARRRTPPPGRPRGGRGSRPRCRERRARPKPAEEPRRSRSSRRPAHARAPGAHGGQATRGTRETRANLESTASRGTGRARNARTLAGDQPAAADVFSERKSSRSNPERTRRGAEDRAVAGPAIQRTRTGLGNATDARDSSSESNNPDPSSARAVASAPGRDLHPRRRRRRPPPPPPPPLLRRRPRRRRVSPRARSRIDRPARSPRRRSRRSRGRLVARPVRVVADRLDATADPGTFLVVQLPAVPRRRAAGPTGIGDCGRGTATDPRGRVGGDESTPRRRRRRARRRRSRRGAPPPRSRTCARGTGELVVRADGRGAEVGETVLTSSRDTFAHAERSRRGRVRIGKRKKERRAATPTARSGGRVPFWGACPEARVRPERG